MQTVKVEYPTDWPYAHVYPLADWHIGDKHCLEGLIAETIETVKNDPYGLCVLNGDLMNTALRNSVSDVYAEIMSPMKQVETLVEMLSPIKCKIIGATTGNHENRVYKNDGLDMMRLVCRELGIEDRYAPEGILIFLHFGTKEAHGAHIDKYPRQSYALYASHGTVGGRREGAKLIRLADMASICDADVYIMGHTHLPVVMKQNYFRCNFGNSCAVPIERLFVNTSAMLDYGGYGQAQGYKPSSTSCPFIRLDAKKKRMTATM